MEPDTSPLIETDNDLKLYDSMVFDNFFNPYYHQTKLSQKVECDAFYGIGTSDSDILVYVCVSDLFYFLFLFVKLIMFLLYLFVFNLIFNETSTWIHSNPRNEKSYIHERASIFTKFSSMQYYRCNLAGVKQAQVLESEDTTFSFY